jgi:hypothetical protein
MFFRRKQTRLPTFEDEIQNARNSGFAVEGSDGKRVRLSKMGCAAVVEPVADHDARFVERPGIVIDGKIAKLLDRGYQKFLVTSEGKRYPATAEQLSTLHQFEEEIRKVLRLPSLYNLSLGTVSNRYMYDRVEGRE